MRRRRRGDGRRRRRRRRRGIKRVDYVDCGDDEDGEGDGDDGEIAAAGDDGADDGARVRGGGGDGPAAADGLRQPGREPARRQVVAGCVAMNMLVPLYICVYCVVCVLSCRLPPTGRRTAS